MIDAPACPACDKPATPRMYNGNPRWACDTPDCPIECFTSPDLPCPVVRNVLPVSLFERRSR